MRGEGWVGGIGWGRLGEAGLVAKVCGARLVGAGVGEKVGWGGLNGGG